MQVYLPTSCAKIEPVSSHGRPYSTRSAVTWNGKSQVCSCRQYDCADMQHHCCPYTRPTTNCDGSTAQHSVHTSQRESATVLNCGTMLIRRLPSRREPMTVRMDLYRQSQWEMSAKSAPCHTLVSASTLYSYQKGPMLQCPASRPVLLGQGEAASMEYRTVLLAAGALVSVAGLVQCCALHLQ